MKLPANLFVIQLNRFLAEYAMTTHSHAAWMNCNNAMMRNEMKKRWISLIKIIIVLFAHIDYKYLLSFV